MPPVERAADRRVDERRTDLADTMERRRESDASAAELTGGQRLEVTQLADVVSPEKPARAASKPQAESPLVIVARI